MSIERKPVSLTVNGVKVGPNDVPVEMRMASFLHEYLGLTGARVGCGQGVCSACAVMVEEPDGSLREIRTCITGVHAFAGKAIRTIEGVATKDAKGEIVLSPVQKAFVDNFSFQCGYCTPGFVIAATVFLDKLRREPVEAAELEDAIIKALDHHICRCTGYVRYLGAVKKVALATPGLVKGAAA